jgi:hypothetical protein
VLGNNWSEGMRVGISRVQRLLGSAGIFPHLPA